LSCSKSEYSKCIKWDENSIKNKIIEVMRVLDLNRMPSSRETIAVTGNYSLGDAIMKHGGFYFWANKLNVKSKNCETSLGRLYEEKSMKVLEDMGYTIQRMKVGYPFDLLINNKIKIDVKTSRPHMCNGSRVHMIGINKKYAVCDLYLVYALDELDNIERIFIVPGYELKIVSMSFGKESIYNIYINKWDLIKKYDDFYNSLDGKVKINV